jgi:hypothetical protein
MGVLNRLPQFKSFSKTGVRTGQLLTALGQNLYRGDEGCPNFQ